MPKRKLNVLKKLLSNKWAIPVVTLLAGMAIGAIFYPSKSITREETARYEAKIEKLEEEKKSIKALSEVTLKSMEAANKSMIAEKESKISSLRTENTHLKKKTKERIVKIISPDGTIREEIVRESDTEIVSQIVTDIKQEFNEKVTSIESKWKKIHETRVVTIRETYEKKLSDKQHIIDTYSKKETIKINERKFGISVGYTNDQRYYGGVSYDVFGPVFLDLHLDADPKVTGENQLGVGIGFRF